MFLTVILTSSLIEMMWVPWLKPHKITIFSLTRATIIYKKSKLNAFCTKNACTKLKQPLTGNIFMSMQPLRVSGDGDIPDFLQDIVPLHFLLLYQVRMFFRHIVVCIQMRQLVIPQMEMGVVCCG